MKPLENALAVFAPNTWLGALILAVAMVIIGLLLAAGVRRMVHAILQHDKSDHVDPISLSFLSQLAVLVVWILMLTIYAHVVPALNKLGTTLLAGVGLLSVIVGFAAQQTLGNLVAGVSLVLYKPFRRGDRLQVTAPASTGCETGTVEAITLGFIVLRTDDGRAIIISNGTMAQQTFIKLTSSR